MHTEKVEKALSRIKRRFLPLLEDRSWNDLIRVQMLTNRGNDSSNKHSFTWVNKLISYNLKSFFSNVENLLHQQYYLNNPDIRLYATINSREIDAAIKKFHHSIIDLYDSTKNDFYINIHDRFISALMKPDSRDSNFYLVDIDDKGKEGLKVCDYISQETRVIAHYPTPGGFHFIVHPFDTRGLEQFDSSIVELKKDAMMLLNVIDFEDKEISYDQT